MTADSQARTGDGDGVFKRQVVNPTRRTIPLQRLDKRDLVQRIRTLERELDAERRLRGTLAYDEQALRAKLLRVETEIVLIQADRSPGYARDPHEISQRLGIEPTHAHAMGDPHPTRTLPDLKWRNSSWSLDSSSG